MVRNVIFDWSGTLSNDFDSLYSVVSSLFMEIGIGTISRDEFRKEFRLPYMDFWRKYTKLGYAGLKPRFDRLMAEKWSPKPFDGTASLLKEVHERKLRMVLLTSHIPEYLEKELSDYGFRGYFSRVASGIMDKREAIGTLADEEGFRKSDTAFVGDMAHDIETGKKAGIAAIAVLWGYDTKDKLEEAGPDYIVRSFSELKRVLVQRL